MPFGIDVSQEQSLKIIKRRKHLKPHNIFYSLILKDYNVCSTDEVYQSKSCRHFLTSSPPFPAICTIELHPSKVTSVNFADCGIRFVKMERKNRGTLAICFCEGVNKRKAIERRVCAE